MTGESTVDFECSNYAFAGGKGVAEIEHDYGEKRETVPVVSAHGLAKVLSRRWIATFVFVIALLKFGSVGTNLARDFSPADFSVYYCSSVLLLRGQDPYSADLRAVATKEGLEKGYVVHLNNPPTFLLAWTPLALLSAHQSYWTWQAINVAALAASLFLLFAPRYSGLDSGTALSLAGLAILYPPVGNDLVLAQGKIVILLLLVGALRFMQRRRDGTAGMLLAAAGLLWVFPLLLGGYALLRRRWRMLTFLIAGVAIGGLATIAIIGTPTSIGFLRSLTLVSSRTWLSSPSNVSLAAVISRGFWYFFGTTPGSGVELARLLCVGGADLMALFLVARATLTSAPENQDGRILSLWVAASIALSPTAWFHYLLLMLIPFAEIASTVARGRAATRALWMAVASYLLAGLIASLLAAAGSNLKLVHLLLALEALCLWSALAATYWLATDPVQGSIGDAEMAPAAS